MFMDKLKDEKVMVFEKFLLDNGKTSFFHNQLASMGLLKKKITLLVSENNDNLSRAVNNLSYVYVVNVNCVSIYELLDCEFLLMDERSFNSLIQMLTK